MTNEYIYEYVYNRKNDRVGVIAAAVDERDSRVVSVGWSRCNANAGDHFDRELGVKIAVMRARKGSQQIVPNSMTLNYFNMAERAKRYFKDKKVIA